MFWFKLTKKDHVTLKKFLKFEGILGKEVEMRISVFLFFFLVLELLSLKCYSYKSCSNIIFEISFAFPHSAGLFGFHSRTYLGKIHLSHKKRIVKGAYSNQ